LWGFPLSNTVVLPLDELSVGICQSVEQAVSSSAHTWKQKSQRKTNKQQLLHHVKLIIADTQSCPSSSTKKKSYKLLLHLHFQSEETRKSPAIPSTIALGQTAQKRHS
jgi:hypothetical protein